jgi:AAA domain
LLVLAISVYSINYLNISYLLILGIVAVFGVVALFYVGQKTTFVEPVPVAVTTEPDIQPPVVEQVNSEFELYRTSEFARVRASLVANSSIMVVGEEGIGKSALGNAVAESLGEENFLVTYVEPSTSKQMLLQIAHDLEVETQSLDGKSLNIERLKQAIAVRFQAKTAFLIVDDVHICDLKFRIWLKELRYLGVPMLLLATDPPKRDVFLRIPRIELRPLPESAIRSIMEQAAIELGISLTNAELSKLQERAGGNPMLAKRAVEEEHLGLDVEGADHRRYFDITPLILLGGITFVVMRFIGLGTNNQALYIFSGIAAAIFLGVSRLLYSLPRESTRIR